MRPTLKENQIYRAVIEGYASDGSGVARIEGMAVFVRGAIRDEVTDIRIEHVGHSAAWGHAERVTKLSMARREPESAELLDKDLDIPEMSIQQAEKKIKAYADAHKTGSFACVTPVEAERILREFYGLTARAEQSGAPTGDNGGDAEIIDLGAFL